MRRVSNQEPAGSYHVEFRLKKDSLPEKHAIWGSGVHLKEWLSDGSKTISFYAIF